MSVNQNIHDKLDGFITQNKIPHLLFHGPSGCGKKTIVHKFIENIYLNDNELINKYTMFANCTHVKGIKFIREELKFFAKTHINNEGGAGHFKTIVLFNADKLTTDAQSALRRCIELFSHNTRFFIIVENKYNLLKPILSRLCEIYIDHPTLNGKQSNYNTYNVLSLIKNNDYDNKRTAWLSTEMKKFGDANVNNNAIVKMVNKLFEKGYHGLDIMNYIEHVDTAGTGVADTAGTAGTGAAGTGAAGTGAADTAGTGVAGTGVADTAGTGTAGTDVDALLHKYKLLMMFHKVKSEFRNEKLFMTFILKFLFISYNPHFENILTI